MVGRTIIELKTMVVFQWNKRLLFVVVAIVRDTTATTTADGVIEWWWQWCWCGALLIIEGYTFDRIANNSLFACVAVDVVFITLVVTDVGYVVAVVMTRHLLFSLCIAFAHSKSGWNEILSQFNVQTIAAYKWHYTPVEWWWMCNWTVSKFIYVVVQLSSLFSSSRRFALVCIVAWVWLINKIVSIFYAALCVTMLCTV